MIAYIAEHKEAYGVEPICEVLPIAPSTYYDAKKRPPSARALRDAVLKPEIRRVHAEKLRGLRGREGVAAAEARGDSPYVAQPGLGECRPSSLCRWAAACRGTSTGEGRS